jgi:hypothetical protein
VHVALTYAGSREGSDHLGSYVCNISLHFCKGLFLGLEAMTSRSSNFTAAPRLPGMKGSLMHVAPVCVGSDHFVSYV